jgi:hypothetical protein
MASIPSAIQTQSPFLATPKATGHKSRLGKSFRQKISRLIRRSTSLKLNLSKSSHSFHEMEMNINMLAILSSSIIINLQQCASIVYLDTKGNLYLKISKKPLEPHVLATQPPWMHRL